MSGRSSHYKLLAGESGYGPVCPGCGGEKRRDAKRCHDCRKAGGGEGVHTTGREQAIITFRRDGDGLVRTLHCFGSGIKAQVADGRARLGEGYWVVQCRSTPDTILQDLRPETHGEHRAEMLRRAVS